MGRGRYEERNSSSAADRRVMSVDGIVAKAVKDFGSLRDVVMAV